MWESGFKEAATGVVELRCPASEKALVVCLASIFKVAWGAVIADNRFVYPVVSATLLDELLDLIPASPSNALVILQALARWSKECDTSFLLSAIEWRRGIFASATLTLLNAEKRAAECPEHFAAIVSAKLLPRVVLEPPERALFLHKQVLTLWSGRFTGILESDSLKVSTTSCVEIECPASKRQLETCLESMYATALGDSGPTTPVTLRQLQIKKEYFPTAEARIVYNEGKDSLVVRVSLASQVLKNLRARSLLSSSWVMGLFHWGRNCDEEPFTLAIGKLKSMKYDKLPLALCGNTAKKLGHGHFRLFALATSHGFIR
ncbi:hypothetical protein DFJ73DRAFT_755788 [Zopfochytrium polystomum]|nr:hypothetical protein DFJ73DRAFT_755788 [Zopfochytrium polystomum]